MLGRRGRLFLLSLLALQKQTLQVFAYFTLGPLEGAIAEDCYQGIKKYLGQEKSWIGVRLAPTQPPNGAAVDPRLPQYGLRGVFGGTTRIVWFGLTRPPSAAKSQQGSISVRIVRCHRKIHHRRPAWVYGLAFRSILATFPR